MSSKEQFEEWARSQRSELDKWARGERCGEYKNPVVAKMWQAWQASRVALEIALPVLEQQEKGDDGWIEWGGGACPVAPFNKVQAKFRDGDVSDTLEKAKYYDWKHQGQCYDIIAYRVVQQERERGEEA